MKNLRMKQEWVFMSPIDMQRYLRRQDATLIRAIPGARTDRDGKPRDGFLIFYVFNLKA